MKKLAVAFFLVILLPGRLLALREDLTPPLPNKKIIKEHTAGLKSGIIDRYLADIVYIGGESFKYEVFYSGGIKIGEIFLDVTRSGQCDDCYEIGSTITSKGGAVHYLYPIEDIHSTLVRGKDRLPYFSEIWQAQGKNYRAHKTIVYDQEKHIIVKQKEGEPERTYQLDGVVHNEFSSFFSSRVMDLEVGSPFLVPTFGDDKRNEVVVVTQEKAVLEKTLFGMVNTLKVTPILTFSGLYDKKGDTTIWYTDDECRVPVLIKSKIVIGSLTATLAQYTNPLCQRYNEIIKQQ